MQKLIGMETTTSETLCAVSMPTWTVIATSKVVMEKYSNFEFNCTEDVINLVVSWTADKTKCLWSPD